MPNGIICPKCQTQLSVESSNSTDPAFCPVCDEFVDVDTRLATGSPPAEAESYVDTRIGTDPMPSPPEQQTEKTQPRSVKINRSIHQPFPLQFFVTDDPEIEWSGTLTLNGLVLAKAGTKEEILIPYGTNVQAKGTRLQIPHEGKEVTLTLCSSGMNQAAAARDLASLLRCERNEFNTGDYRLPRYLWALASLAMLGSIVYLSVPIPVRFLSDYRWIAPGFFLSAVLMAKTWWGTSSVRLCTAVFLFLAIAANAASVHVILLRYGLLDDHLPGPPVIEENAWLRFVPRNNEYEIDFPGKPISEIANMKGDPWPIAFDRVKLGESYYSVGVVAYPDSQKDPLQFHKDITRQIPNARLVSEVEVEQQGLTGTEITMQVPSITNTVTRIFLVKNRVYRVQAAGLGYKADSPNVARFFSSFRIR